MQKKEAQFQTRFNRWCKYNIYETSVFELKYSKKDSLPFRAVQPHQVQNLLNAKHRKMLWKIPDDSIGEKPFDSFLIAGSGAYIVIQFAKSPPEAFFIIDIDAFVKEMKKSKRKSLTLDMVKNIGKECHLGSVDSFK